MKKGYDGAIVKVISFDKEYIIISFTSKINGNIRNKIKKLLFIFVFTFSFDSYDNLVYNTEKPNDLSN